MAVRENGVWVTSLGADGQRLFDALPAHVQARYLADRNQALPDRLLAQEVQAIIDEYPGLAFEPVLVRVVEALRP